ncbi:ATP-binding cassette domain-containing protein [Mycolicibacterium smegmatis]|uniref:ATP-binding cassette domain-containing protein n=1 Tax=Mycolicibacterium smegmatis TaxID=1772 RepID=UPI0013032D66|nr:ATP-binding cassette domain-containing protein [Mycolicibacterium smegmatis]
MPQLTAEPDPDADEQKPPAITAREITMRGPFGPVYGPVDLDIAEGGVTALVAPSGAGRTALLLTLAGRMKPQSGEVTVLGRTRAKDIFDISAVAAVEDIDAVPESVTVADVITEQRRWDAPWYRRVPRAGTDDLAALCGPVFGDLPLPPLGEYFDELTELDRVLLRIALANTSRPPLLVVGDFDHVTDDRNRELLAERLIALGEQQTVVTATVNPVSNPAVTHIAVPNTTPAELASAQKGEK